MVIGLFQSHLVESHMNLTRNPTWNPTWNPDMESESESESDKLRQIRLNKFTFSFLSFNQYGYANLQPLQLLRGNKFTAWCLAP